MEAEKIDRINVLAHKAKSVGLTEEEKKERELLRKEYLASVRMNLRSQLDNIDVKKWTMERSLIWEKNMDSKKTLEKRFSRKENFALMSR